MPGTKSELPPEDQFSGREIVYVPIHVNHGRKPWKNPVPDWLVPWLAEAQAADKECKWSICGYSRGAAWGAVVAADPWLTFSRVLLIGPYVLPCLSQ